ncbi:MAG: LysR family transcriptional regulator, partial [Segetibacter sp.]|nr:LysR family transcriptional regulator [Segetibacter sp.]
MFDFRLKVFHTVAKRLSFTKAAADLFITQPAVTKHIQELEQHFKVQLFERQ